METIKEFINPIMETLGTYLPNAVGAILLLFVGWVIALVIRRLVAKLLRMGKVDERLKGDSGKPVKISEVFGKLVYYAFMLCVLLLVLDVLGVKGILEPVRNMLDQFLGMFPNVVGAILIGFLGYIVARMISSAAVTLLKHLDELPTQMGLGKHFKLSRLVGQLVFIFIFVPILVAALDVLKIEAISGPATNMLAMLMGAIPDILAAALILVVAFFVGRFLTSVISNLLKNLGVDGWPARIGLGKIFSEKTTFSKFCGRVIFFFVMFGATIAAVEKLGMQQVALLLNNSLTFAGQIALGLTILAIGNFIANFAYKALSATTKKSFAATIARIAILGLVFAMGLRAMGIADDIVNLAFGLSLGSLAAVVALAFGLGGREAAGKQMDYWLSKLRKEE